MRFVTDQHVAIFRDRDHDTPEGWPAVAGEAQVVFFRVEDAPVSVVRWARVTGPNASQRSAHEALKPIYALTVREHGEPPHGCAVVWRCSLHCHCQAATEHGRADFVAWHWDEALGRVASLFTEGAHTLTGAPRVRH